MTGPSPQEILEYRLNRAITDQRYAMNDGRKIVPNSPRYQYMNGKIDGLRAALAMVRTMNEEVEDERG